MLDIALTTDTHDIYLESTGDLALAAGVDVVRQLLVVGLRLFRGEWYLEEDAGIPYYQDVLTNAPSSRVIEALFRQAILSTDEVESLTSFTMTIDRASRRLDVDFTAVSSEGEVEVSEVFP